MNRAQLRSALVARLGIPSTGDGRITESVQTDCLNLALTDLGAGEHQWPWLLTTGDLTFTAGVAPMPTDPPVVHCRELFVNGRRARKASSLAELLDVGVDGSRCLWFYQGTNVVLAPAPSVQPTDGVLYYLQPEPELVADAQSPLVPAQFHNIVVARACYHAAVMKREWESAAQYNGEYEQGLKHMAGSARFTTGPRQIRTASSTLWAVW